jgi:hypothetical protein
MCARNLCRNPSQFHRDSLEHTLCSARCTHKQHWLIHTRPPGQAPPFGALKELSEQACAAAAPPPRPPTDPRGPIYVYIIRAVAGIASACGPGASPTPNLRESARDVPRTRKYRLRRSSEPPMRADCPIPSAIAHSPQGKRMSQPVLFLDSSRRGAGTAHFPSGRLHP